MVFNKNEIDIMNQFLQIKISNIKSYKCVYMDLQLNFEKYSKN